METIGTLQNNWVLLVCLGFSGISSSCKADKDTDSSRRIINKSLWFTTPIPKFFLSLGIEV